MSEINAPQLIGPHKRRKRVRRLQFMLVRIRSILRQKAADPTTQPIVLHTLLAEIAALEWVLGEIGEAVPTGDSVEQLRREDAR